MAWLSLFLFLLMLGIMFFQTIHGLFSAMIMAVLSVLCATLALGVHEQLAEEVLYDSLGDYAYPASLLGVFAASLITTRLLADKFISRNTLLPLFIDRGGATAFGIITGLVTIGTVGIGFQMTPFGPTIMGFQRFDETGAEHGLWLNPDKFTLYLCGMLADKTLRGDQEWKKINPNLLTQLHWLRNSESPGSKISAGPNSVRATGLATTSRLYDMKRQENTGQNTLASVEGPPPGMVWLVVSATVGDQAKDSDGFFRTSATQTRLVGEDPEGTTQQFTLKGIGPVENNFVTFSQMPVWGNQTGTFDFVFEVPKGFKPRFVEFKRSGRADLSEASLTSAGQLADRTPAALPTAPDQTQTAQSPNTGAGTNPGDNARTSPVRPKVGSHFGDDMPMSLNRYSGAFIEYGGGGNSLKSGHLTLWADRQGGGNQPPAGGNEPAGIDPEKTPLNKFDVPSELRMLQLNVEALQATTVLGGALNFARRALQQYHVVDDHGNKYWPAGVIAECDADGGRVMEIQFFPEEAQIRNPLRDFNKIRHDQLQGDYQLVFLFLVPPTTKIVKFDVGNKPYDLTNQNLVAPN